MRYTRTSKEYAMELVEHVIRLTKRASTRDGYLHLTSDEEVGVTGVRVKKPIYAVYSFAKNGEGSRLENWRSLLTEGREVKVTEEQGDNSFGPVLAQIKLVDGDVKVWDSEPVEGREWVVFWVTPSTPS
jgi:hypothetical protein